MITFPTAKINLGLHITAKRPDGYHHLETVFYPIPLGDALEIHVMNDANRKIFLHQTGLKLAGSAADNLVVKAYSLLDKEFGLPPIEVHLYKQIPSGAGLGGGSSDAASMLKLLNERFALQLTDDRLEAYAATLGADCAFFIQNRATFAEGIGNLFSPLSLSLKGYRMLLVKPLVSVSTREAFALIEPKQPKRCLKEVIAQPIDQWREALVNDFEVSVFRQYPVLDAIKKELYRMGALYASMSGSGSSLFGLFAPDVVPDVSLPTAFGQGAFVKWMELE